MWSLSIEYDDIVEDTKSSTKIDLVRKKPKLPKPKLKPPTALERVFGKLLAAKDHYFSAGLNINENNQRNVHAEALPFKYPSEMENFSYKVMSKAWRDTRRKQENKYKYNERPSYRLRQKLDLLNRLYVKEPQVKSIKMATDLDPSFFKQVEGRPVAQKMNRWDYISDIRDVLRLKIVNGYREDDIMLIEETFASEQKIIDEIQEEFQKYVDTFEEFLFADHTQSMKVLREADEQSLIADEKYEILNKLSMEYGSLKSAVYALEEKWRNCKLYQKFLYLLSPMEWRKVNDYFYIQSPTHMERESEVFERYKLKAVGEVLSLENLIDQFLYDIEIQDEPKLYFTEPYQLMKAFRFIEIQNLNILLHSEELAIPLEQFKEAAIKSEKEFNEEIASLQETISNLEGGIIWEEQRAKFLEELALELINGAFREIICNDDAVNLHVFIEDVYENRIALNDSNLTMKNMMKIIELKYLEYLLELDRLPDTYVHIAESTCYKEQAKIMKTAEEAARKVVQVERLMKRLSRLLEPPVYKTTRSLKWRSKPPEKKVKPPPPPRPLTQNELEFLTFFVDFCNQTDDPKDYGIDTEVKK